MDVEVPTQSGEGTGILVLIQASSGPFLAIGGLTCAKACLSPQAQVSAESLKNLSGHQEFAEPHLQAVTTLQAYGMPSNVHRIQAASLRLPHGGKKVLRLSLRLAKTYYRLYAP